MEHLVSVLGVTREWVYHKVEKGLLKPEKRYLKKFYKRSPCWSFTLQDFEKCIELRFGPMALEDIKMECLQCKTPLRLSILRLMKMQLDVYDQNRRKRYANKHKK